MKKMQVNLFGTRSDFEPGVRLMDSRRPLQYVLSGLFDSNEPKIYRGTTLLADHGFGFSQSGSHVIGDQYLVTDIALDPHVRIVPQRKGGVKYAFDSIENPDSILFFPGGIFEATNIVSGQVWRGSETAAATELYRDFTSALTKNFKRVGAYMVGPEALSMMQRGFRMITITSKSPPEYDLRL